MQLITAADKKFEGMLQISLKHNKYCGYDTVIYDLNNTLGYGNPFFIHPSYLRRNTILEKKDGKSPFKPEIIKHACTTYKNEKTIVWLDADAFVIRKFDEIDAMNDFDIGVTMRTPEESNKVYNEWAGYINAGVMFFKPSDKILKFLDLWQEESLKSEFNSDQHAINKILLRYSDLSNRNCIIFADDIRVKIFMTETYNFYYWPFEPSINTKIIHLKEHRNIPECMNTWGNKYWD